MLPETFLKKVRDVHGRAGEAWLAHLPDLIEACEGRWSVRVLEPFPNLSYNFVAPACSHDGNRFVLKLGVPGADFFREGEALTLYGGEGSVALLGTEPELAAHLLEHVPGPSLWRHEDDDEATRVAAHLIARLHRPVADPHPFRTLQDYTGAIGRYLEAHQRDGPLPYRLVTRADGLLGELLDSKSVLLHADLHHGNVLAATREPHLAIDPKGIVGPRGYDVGPFLMNPTPEVSRVPGLKSLLERRVAIFAEMSGMDEREVAAWGFVHAILSSLWSFEDHPEEPGESREAALVVARELALL